MNFWSGLIVTLFALHMAYRMRARGPVDAIKGLSGYVIVFYATSFFLTTLLPRQATHNINHMNNWQPIWNQGGRYATSAYNAVGRAFGAGQPLVDSAGSLPADGRLHDEGPAVPPLLDTAGPLPPPSDTAANDSPLTDTAASGSPAGVNPDPLADPNVGGGAPAGDTAVQPPPSTDSPPFTDTAANDPLSTDTAVMTDTTAAQPPASPTPDPILARLPALYQQLDEARANGNREVGRSLTDSILTLRPDDEVALAAQAEIQAAEATIARRGRLITDIGPSIRPGQEGQQQVAQALGAGSFVIVDSGAAIYSAKCSEYATIRDTSAGWTYGHTFKMRRCYLEAYGVQDTGQLFHASTTGAFQRR